MTVVRHHLTATGLRGYFDPDLVVDLLPYLHDELHAILRAAGLDQPSALLADTVAGRVELRLRRLAVGLDFVAREGCQCRHKLLDSLGLHCERWAEELRRELEDDDS